jgi:hypothetical protein
LNCSKVELSVVTFVPYEFKRLSAMHSLLNGHY